MRRASSLLLLLLLMTSLLFGCGGKAPSDEELLTAAGELVAASVMVNEVFLGDGIPTGDFAFDGYRHADDGWMEDTGLHSVDTLVAAARAVYSTEVVAMLTRFACLDDEEELPHYRDNVVDDSLYVLASREGLFHHLSFVYKTGEMTVEEKRAGSATVLLGVCVTQEDGQTREKTLRLPLVKGDDGWRLDKLTYVAFEDVD